MNKDSFWCFPQSYYGWRWLPPALLGIVLLLLYPAPALSWTQNSLAKPLLALPLIIPLVWSVRLRILSRIYAGQHTRSHVQQAPELITQGPFALVRNPLYLSNLTMALTLVLLRVSGSDYSLLVVGLHSLFWGVLLLAHYQLVILQEESDLRKRFSESADWQDWRSKTPRWFRWSIVFLPLKPLKNSEDKDSRWKTAAREDIWTWIWQVLAFLLVLFFPAAS